MRSNNARTTSPVPRTSPPSRDFAAVIAFSVVATLTFIPTLAVQTAFRLSSSSVSAFAARRRPPDAPKRTAACTTRPLPTGASAARKILASDCSFCFFGGVASSSRVSSRHSCRGVSSRRLRASNDGNGDYLLASPLTRGMAGVAVVDDIPENGNSTASTSSATSSATAAATAAATKTATSTATASVVGASPAARWHRERRRKMLAKYGDAISKLERDSKSEVLGLTLLAFSNASLLGLALLSGRLNVLQIFGLALFPGSIFSLWTLQILHDCLHGSLLDKRRTTYFGGGLGRMRMKTLTKTNVRDALLFWGSMPSAFGYYLYLRYGHLTHHRSLGDADSASLAKLFDSDERDFADGDVLFVAHRMKLKGEVGPKFALGTGKNKREVTVSISKSGFDLWREGRTLRNGLTFAVSFMYERMMLVFNDAVVAVTGRNYFFPNKPPEFHKQCARYCRCALAVRGCLWAVAGWKSLFFLYLAETLWSIPPHPACAMFVSNHGSSEAEESNSSCVPSSSTYAGKWYSILTLGTNYHCEHHDFPTIPLHRLGELRKIAPEFYRRGSDDSLLKIMGKAFSRPEFYACMDAGIDLGQVEMWRPSVA